MKDSAYKKVFYLDENGNEIEGIGGKYYLKLRSENRSRLLGELVFHNGIPRLSCKRDRDKHLFRANESWGFCYCLLINLMEQYPNLRIGVITSDAIYSISGKEIMDNGHFLQFSEAGFEKQIFYPLEKFNILTEKLNNKRSENEIGR